LIVLDKFRHLLVVPVAESKNVFFLNLYRVLLLRVADDKRCSKAIRILSHVVGVIPISASLVDFERIGEEVAFGLTLVHRAGSTPEERYRTWRNWALGSADGTVHGTGTKLSDAMPVERG
jgi:hypothetical protein